jgi:uncharacterized protein
MFILTRSFPFVGQKKAPVIFPRCEQAFENRGAIPLFHGVDGAVDLRIARHHQVNEEHDACLAELLSDGKPLPNIPVDNSMRSYYISAMKLPDFEWDDLKNAQNTEKHGVSFYEAQYAFADTQRVIIEDLDHGGDEDRFFCFGKVKGGVMTVRFTVRESRIRIIGAGYWRKGKKIYDQENHIHG